jgi:hypothetical protein
MLPSYSPASAVTTTYGKTSGWSHPLVSGVSLPDSFYGAPADARTKALLGRTPLLHESFIAAGTVATRIEKTS